MPLQRPADCTQSDWEIFGDSGKTFQQKALAFFERMQMLRVTQPNEATIKGGVALINVVHLPDTDASQLHGMALTLKAFIMMMECLLAK